MTVYDRNVLVEVLIYHWSTSTSGCGCGWAELGHSHPEHVADVYEASIAAREPEQNADYERIARAELADDPEYRGFSEHARNCREPWCVGYLKVYEAAQIDSSGASHDR